MPHRPDRVHNPTRREREAGRDDRVAGLAPTELSAHGVRSRPAGDGEEYAPHTPAPGGVPVFAALTIASTRSAVMSPRAASTSMRASCPTGSENHGYPSGRCVLLV